MGIEPATAAKRTANHTSISLVLGAGGARGYAHIGVIEELLAQGFDIRAIAGSSMGALIGGIYAAGKLDAYSEWVRPLQRFDVLRLLDWTLSGGGFIKGNRIIDVLRDLIGDTDIEALPIPFTAVAVDLDAQREVWFSQGPLFNAIRASIAIPTVFRPYRHEGRLLVDGGLLNPLPVSATLRDHTDFTIAVDVNASPETSGRAVPNPLAGTDEDTDASTSVGAVLQRWLPEVRDDDKPQGQPAGYRDKLAAFMASLRHRSNTTHAPEPGMFDLFARSLDTVQATITRLKLAAQPPDLLIGIPRNASAFYEFHRAEELINLGRERTREALSRWQPMPRKH